MRKNCKQTYEPKGLMQILSKGGWQKKVKKATAAILAAAMVLTSGVVLPQNTKTAEAAPLATVGASNGSGGYTCSWFVYPDGYSKIMPEGDFSVSYSFHQEITGDDWDGFWVCLTPNFDPLGNEDATGKDWAMRSDAWSIHSFSGSTVGTPVINGDWKSTRANAEVTVGVERIGTTITMTANQTNASGTYTYSVASTNCPTGKLAVCLTGDACQLTVNSETVLPRHELTVNCVDTEGTVLKTETKTFLENRPYSFDAPAITGYIPTPATVTGTMGTADDTVTVTYASVPTKNVIIHCVSTTGAEISTKTEKAPINLPFEFDVPDISGYLPLSTEPIAGDMLEEDQEFTVQYKPYSTVLNIGENWSNLTTGYKVKKSGDFDIAFSFHNVSTGAGTPDWANYAIGISTDTVGDWAHAWSTGGWFQVANRNSILTFTGEGADFFTEGSGKTYTLHDFDGTSNWDDVDWAAIADTLKESDVTVGISRKGSTISITSNVIGANGKTFSWTATDTKCPTDTVAVTLTGENCKLYLYDVPESDPAMVPPVDTNTDGVIDTIGSGTYDDITLTDYDKFHAAAAPTNDFTVTYNFHNTSAGTTNWYNYAVVLQNSEGKTWTQRADWWSEGQAENAAVFGKGVPTYSDIYFADYYGDTIKDADVTVTVVRSGTTITIYHSVNGANGKSYSYSATATDCPTDDIKVMLGGWNCKIKLTGEDVKNEASEPADQPTAAPSTEPSAEPTVTPSTEPTGTPAPTDPPATDEPTPTVAPSAKPVIKNGDKVTNSGATYKVTSTKNKAVSYTAAKSSKSTSVTVPNTVKVTSNGKKVTYKVTTIAKNTFKGNKTVKKVTIGKNITKIEANAFKNCKNLTTIVIKSDKLTSVAKNALSGTNKKLVIKVPAKKVSAYQKLFSGKGNANVVVKKA